VVSGFSLFIDEPVLEKVDLTGIPGPIERYVVYPLVPVASALKIFEFKMFIFAQSGDLGDPLEQNLVIGGLSYEDIGHAVFLDGIDKRLFGVKVITCDDDGEFGVRFSDFFNDSFARVRLAVLFGVSV
jgi:hypothetical protein